MEQAGNEFFETVRGAYHKIAQTESRFCILDGAQTPEMLHQQILQDVQQILPGEQRTSQLFLNKTMTALSLSAASIQLSDGVNVLTFVAVNEVGKSTTIKRVVRFDTTTK